SADLFINETFGGIVINRDRATDANAVTAAHRRFERELRRRAEPRGYLRDSMQHRVGAAGVYDRFRAAARNQVFFQRRGHKSRRAEPAVQGRENDILFM